ncbi:uncharacterized protein LOC142557471 [Dermacentor variabilis]|uniref:uncharacterized protein LOC142557471 n=1 Tax=Dermacentor variabilis TaxID=34621 RepID=UPI003F5B0073
MTLLSISFVALYLAVLTLQTTANDDWHQRRVQSPIFDEINGIRKKYRKKSVGQPCKGTDECYPRLCCRQRGGAKTCQALSRFGQKCTNDQLKGGSYLGHCPCDSRAGHCYMFRGRRFGECSYAKRR